MSFPPSDPHFAAQPGDASKESQGRESMEGADAVAATGSASAEERGDGAADLNAPGLTHITPRAALADAFETNPLSALRAAHPEGLARHELEDSVRVREALRSVITAGERVNDAARDWNVAPSSIAAWRARYQEMIREAEMPGVPLFEIETGPKDHDLTLIPEAAREIFSENWNRLVQDLPESQLDFSQKPFQLFLQTSPLTSWMYQEGELEHGLVAGTLSGLVALAVLVSFLTADHARPAAAVPPEPIVLEAVEIDRASAVADAFWKAPTIGDRLKLLRDVDSVRPMVEDYYRRNSREPITDAVLTLAMPLGKVVNLSYEVPSLARTHFLCVVFHKGQYLVDWESSSLYQESQIARVREEKSVLPRRIAVMVTRREDENYFNYAFQDEQHWVCYQLGYPGMPLNFYGYAPRGSAESIALDAMLGIVGKKAVVLQVKFPRDATVDNQVEIVSVVRDEWVALDP